MTLSTNSITPSITPVQGLAGDLLLLSQELAAVKYFTSSISTSRAKQERQNAYLDALRTKPLVEIIFGRFQPDRKECDKCGHPAYHPKKENRRKHRDKPNL